MSKRAKQRRARSVALNAVDLAIEGSRCLPAEDVRLVEQGMRAALRALRMGLRPEFQWGTLADGLNAAECLADEGIASDRASRERIRVAQETLSTILLRHKDGGGWRIEPVELAALEEGIWLHSVQLGLCSRREYERAIVRMIERQRQALAGNPGRGVTVLRA